MKPYLQATLLILAMIASQSKATAQQPYAGMQARSVKALSDQQVADLKAGRGMSLALAAELNGYPGPLHVLELSNELLLGGAQREQIEKLFASMKAETIPLGERLINLEIALDHQFSSRSITQASLTATTKDIGGVQGSLRAAHLKYHLLTLDLLTREQVARYSELRGYAQSEHEGRKH